MYRYIAATRHKKWSTWMMLAIAVLTQAMGRQQNRYECTEEANLQKLFFFEEIKKIFYEDESITIYEPVRIK